MNADTPRANSQRNSLQQSRRTFLRGAGVAMASSARKPTVEALAKLLDTVDCAVSVRTAPDIAV